MIRAVFDANVLVSYLLTHRPPIATLIERHLAGEDLILVTTLELLEEVDRVLRYAKLQRYYSDTERERFVALLMALSEVVELPDSIPRICRDPDGDRVIACAVAGVADVIVSGDRDLLALEQVGEIAIQSAAQFLEMPEQTNGPLVRPSPTPASPFCGSACIQMGNGDNGSWRCSGANRSSIKSRHPDP